MQRRHYGRAGTEVIPARWATDHQPVAAKTMVGAKATFRKPGSEQAWDEDSQEMVEVPKAPYATELRCRVQSLETQDRTIATAEDTETVTTYLVVVPAGLDALEGDLVQVDLCDDEALDGLRLQVRQVVRGSIRFERDLFCTLTD